MFSHKYLKGGVKEYLDELAKRKATPGGGSAGAMAGSLAIALLSMVANFSIGKGLKGEDRIKEILEESEELRGKMQNLIDEDVRAYEKLSLAFKLPKENKGREKKIQEALKEAVKVPLKITELSLRTCELNKEILPISNPRLISDIGASLSLAYSSVEIGALNVKINLASIKDEEFNRSHREKLDEYLKKSKNIKNEVYPKVEGVITHG